ncbi:putative zinc metalloprotease [Streptomyces spiroverticillatus]|uniref:Zinc metalloprotease n=1 Tax=Streptomyces finlayi TaxID=67296 RepID=A0A919CCG6_9ACTN|nr:site-2 protease family protein [Streptomyces finlayi]GHA25628.1 putative zinc metalloprotease [Streptomyces spiroverticillatus]GHD05286.1 putative zinc metalloprotease [Streptomyces finlayi]
MTQILLTVLGIVIFFVGLLVSIALHELGHLSFAKLFRIRVPQYMVGFGPTIWSRHKGETEYGIKAIPLGGYIRMIGMFPPGADGRIEARSTSPWRGMIEDARSAAYEELKPGDEERLFYTRKPWKRFVVMFAGPFMNLVIAFVLFLGVFMTIGLNKQTTTVDNVVPCVVSQSENRDCRASDQPSPAKAAGLQKGDKIVAYQGQPISDWATLSDRIRASRGKVSITVERAGQQKVLTTTVGTNKVLKKDADGNPVKGEYVDAGYLGFGPGVAVTPLTLGESVDQMGTMFQSGVDSLIALPSKVPDLWNAAFNGEERKADSPMGVVGAARVGGEILGMGLPMENTVAMMVFLVAGFNLSLFLFNMLPLLPLDGGHMIGALWESLRRNLAKVFKRPDPGPFDVARLMPVAYVVAGIFICFTVLVLIADVVNPVRIS